MIHNVLTLNNGIEIPQLGLGTWFIRDDIVADAIKEAVNIGYRHFDTAQAYGNERGVGEGIRNCGIPRDEIFLDMMIIHSPQPWEKVNQSEDRYVNGNREAWKALEDSYKAGKLKAIGLSNFRIGDIENILEVCEIKPMVNQILLHISNTPLELVEYCQGKDIIVEAYSPIAHGEILHQREIAVIAEKYGVSVPQLCIRYTLQLGAVSLPKTGNPEHMRTNAEVDFEISPEDMKMLKNFKHIKDYGQSSHFPVYGGKM